MISLVKITNKLLVGVSAVKHRSCVHFAINEAEHIDFFNDWPEKDKEQFVADMRILPDFLTLEEETSILDEIEPYLKRMRYEFDHWDDAIHGYRETERKQWYPRNRAIIQRVTDIAFSGKIIPFIHVLDLAENGVIKPHVDSTRYCGRTIAGLSLLSDSVMRMRRIDEEKYNQNKEDGTNSDEGNDRRNQQQLPDLSKYNFYADLLLKRRSLYIMSDSARYKYTHEILGLKESLFRNQPIQKTRRISIICRNETQS